MKHCKKEAGAAPHSPSDKQNLSKTAPIGYHFQEEIAPVIRAYTAFEAAVVMSGLLAFSDADIALLEAANSKLEDDVIFLKRFNAGIVHHLHLLTKQVLSHSAEINAVAHDVVTRFGAFFEVAEDQFAQLNADIETYVSEHKDDDPAPAPENHAAGNGVSL